MRSPLIAALAAVTLAVAPALAGPENASFPEYAEGVHYFTLDKADAKRGHTVRKFYITREALTAVKAGKPLPSGTVITREDWLVRLDAAKNPVRDADGKFVPTGRKAVHVMEKRDGWGAGYPAALRNGSWEYATFRPDGTRNTKANVKRCFACHKRKAGDDFVFSLKQLRAAAK